MLVKNRNITVIGMGVTGIAVANFLADRQARVTLIDQRRREQLANVESKLNPTVKTAFETFTPSVHTDYVILSPGVDIDSPFIKEIKENDIPIMSEIELASRFNRTPIISITGTNGKTTTTTLTGKLLDAGGKQVRVGGNIGVPFISLVGDDPLDFLLLEISSFQLEAIKQFRPKIAAILNISPDHLDRHKTFQRYATIKGNLSANQTVEDFLILNADDPEVLKLGDRRSVTKLFFSRERDVGQGAWIEKGTIWVRTANGSFEICEVQSLQQIMQWQVENVLAAVTVAALTHIAPQVIAQTLKEFSGLEHRLEWVRSYRGVDYINDSKGTNVGSVIKSLHSIERPLILIFGGQDKESDFSPLIVFFKNRVKYLILIGGTRPKIKRFLNGIPPFEEAETLDAAVQRASEIAVPGDTVLLSPGCASFDMFKDYADRGNRFKKLVRQID